MSTLMSLPPPSMAVMSVASTVISQPAMSWSSPRRALATSLLLRSRSSLSLSTRLTVEDSGSVM